MKISGVRWLPEARDDLAELKERDPSDAERVAKKVSDIAENLKWNRDPRTHHEWKRLDKEELPDEYSFYRKWIGSSGYRMIVTIVDNEVKIVGSRYPPEARRHVRRPE